MPPFTTPRQNAAALILILGIALLIAVSPYATGLIGGLVLFVLFEPVHEALSVRLKPAWSAMLVVLLAIFVLVVPALIVAGLLVDQAQEIATNLAQAPIFARIAGLRIGSFEVGPRLAGLGEQIITFLGTSALGLIGTATRLGFNVTIALFVVYYLLLRSQQTWTAVKPYIPFSADNAELLRRRFGDVTISTVIGSGLIAAVQGFLVALGFQLTGLGHAMFWGVVTAVFSILPVVGSGLVWGPAVVVLAANGRYGAALLLLAIGAVVVGNVDVLIRPAVFRRYAQIHPLITLVGAIAGLGYFGLLGILIGPLALSYFFELLRMYRQEYIGDGPLITPSSQEP